MNKNIFTQDFYKKVYNGLCDYCKENYGDYYGEATMPASINVDGYDIECTADIDTEWIDESFDHAFGTWYDDNAHYEVADVSGISDVTMYDEDGNELDGFSVDDYEAQFVEDEHDGIKKGDKVVLYVGGRYQENPVEVISYNNRIGKFVVKVERGARAVSRSFMKKVV